MVATETRLPPLDQRENSIIRINSPIIPEPYSYENSFDAQPVEIVRSTPEIVIQLLGKVGQPKELSKDEAQRYRTGPKQSLYTDLLQEGFNKSYQELFNLERSYNEAAVNFGYKIKKISDNDAIKIAENLKQCELFERNDSLVELHQKLTETANMYAHMSFLSAHFLKRAFIVGQKVGLSDENKTLAIAHKNMGLAYFEAEDYQNAFEHLQMYMNIVDNSKWKAEVVPELEPEGDVEVTFYIDGCNNLRLLYIRLGELCKDDEEALGYYQMAHSYAALTDNSLQIKQVSHKLALIYEQLEKYELSAEHLKKFFSLAQLCNDYSNIGSAAEVFAKIYEKTKATYEVDETLDIMEGYVSGVEPSDDSYGPVCSCLGAVFTSNNDLDRAQIFLKMSYDAAILKNNRDALNESKIQVSIATSHQMLGLFAEGVDLNSRHTVWKILNWKNNRTNQFEAPNSRTEEEGEVDNQKLE